MLVPLAKPEYEVADVIRLYADAYRREHALPLQQLKVLRAIERCRTAALGGHIDACDHCKETQISYNSCRNRHCPKCQGSARIRWVAAQQERLLPIEYFHVVFTLPEQLNALCRWNQRQILNLLFETAAKTLLAFGQRHLGGSIGVTALLHTWGETLTLHPHLHCLVTGGALSPDGQSWQTCPSGFLFPVRALSQVFRGKFCQALEKLYQRGELAGQPCLPMLSSRARFAAFLAKLRRAAFVVYAKRPFAGPEQVIGYLGRYTHRVAISNHRLVSVEGGRVSFRWKDYRQEREGKGGKDGPLWKTMTLSASEFLRRFLLHVLPEQFVRIRHFGLLSSGQRRQLSRCQALLGPVSEQCAPPSEEPEAFEASACGEGLPGYNEASAAAGQEAQQAPPVRCPVCGMGRLVRRALVPFWGWPQTGPPPAVVMAQSLAGAV